MNTTELVFLGMTDGEAKVAELVLKGFSNNEISQYLRISEKTVKFHITKIFRKFSCKSRSQFIVKFLNQRPVADSTELGKDVVHGTVRAKVVTQ
jgi:DNA-binding CsgD family transcriptional regulator